MPPVRNARYWRDRSEEVRSIGEGLTDPTSRHILLEIAHDYEKLAMQADARERKAGDVENSIGDDHPR